MNLYITISYKFGFFAAEFATRSFAKNHVLNGLYISPKSFFYEHVSSQHNGIECSITNVFHLSSQSLELIGYKNIPKAWVSFHSKQFQHFSRSFVVFLYGYGCCYDHSRWPQVSVVCINRFLPISISKQGGSVSG